MKFKQEYKLPDGEVPAATVGLVITQSGQLYLVTPDNLDSLAIIGMLGGGIQIQISKARKIEAAAESRIVKPGMALVPPRGSNGNGNGGKG